VAKRTPSWFCCCYCTCYQPVASQQLAELHDPNTVEFCERLESDVRSGRILTSPASNIGSATVASPSSTSASSVQNPEGVEPVRRRMMNQSACEQRHTRRSSVGGRCRPVSITSSCDDVDASTVDGTGAERRLSIHQQVRRRMSRHRGTSHTAAERLEDGRYVRPADCPALIAITTERSYIHRLACNRWASRDVHVH